MQGNFELRFNESVKNFQGLSRIFGGFCRHERFSKHYEGGGQGGMRVSKSLL